MLHGYGPSLLQGAALTLSVAGASLLLALVLGLVGATARLSRSALASRLALAYTTLVRGVPDLVLMLLIFYGGQMALNDLGDRLGWGYIDVDPYLAGVLTMGFIFGAYVAEVLRGAILSVPAGQAEAAQAFGFTRVQVLWRIVGPQMLRHALPGLSNNWLVMLKSTAIVSVIGLSDLTNRAAQASGATGKPFVFYAAVAWPTWPSLPCRNWALPGCGGA
jgi:arginine/ornithine transport system permease protein